MPNNWVGQFSDNQCLIGTRNRLTVGIFAKNVKKQIFYLRNKDDFVLSQKFVSQFIIKLQNIKKNCIHNDKNKINSQDIYTNKYLFTKQLCVRKSKFQ